MMKILTNATICISLLLVTFEKSYGQLTLDSTFLTIDTIAEDLEVPWEIAWGPDDKVWLTERPGNVKRVDPETEKIETLLTIDEVETISESGLLGMAFHPNFLHPDSSFVYLVYTYLKESDLTERVVQYTYGNDALSDPFILLDDIPANNNHNGSRIVILPDRTLLLTTGDAQQTSNSQNESSLAGKILRMNLDGTIPEDNPSPDSYNWTIGHRNPQGLVMADDGTIYSSEHGPSNDDEINIINKGENYGWPDVHGFCDTAPEENFCDDTEVMEPIIAWTPTLAVAGLDYYNSVAIPEWRHSLLLTTLKEDDLRVLRLNEEGTEVIEEQVHFNNAFGRLRDVCVSPDGDIYLSTSNRDGRGNGGFPIGEDDRIIKLSNEHKEITSIPSIENNIFFYPNPSSNTLFINLNKAELLLVSDTNAKSLSLEISAQSIDISHWQPGIYFLTFRTQSGDIVTQKFIKQ